MLIIDPSGSPLGKVFNKGLDTIKIRTFEETKKY